jgi:IS5 family transposase
LIRGDEHAVYGDKAYASQALRDRLADAGIADGLMYKAARNKPLKPWQTWFNKAVAAIRAAVERRFGIMKRGYGFAAAHGSAATPAICSCCAPPSTSSVRWRLPDDARSLPGASRNGEINSMA